MYTNIKEYKGYIKNIKEFMIKYNEKYGNNFNDNNFESFLNYYIKNKEYLERCVNSNKEN